MPPRSVSHIAIYEDVAPTCKMNHARAMLDIASFYDIIPWKPLVEAALRLNFPPVILHLELAQCIAPRVL